MTTAKKKSTIDTLFKPNQAQQLKDFFYEFTGNTISQTKESFVDSRLRKHFTSLNLKFEDYCSVIRSDAKERDKFISLLTTHKTDWFREPIHYRYIADYLSTNKERSKSWSFWSAASSTGEEVYSLFMMLRELNVYNPRILASDISEQCLEKAKAGIYAKELVNKQVYAPLKNKYFKKILSTTSEDSYRIDPLFSTSIKWRQCNLMQLSLNSRYHFDFIFLRNVLIYFRPAEVKIVIDNLCNYLASDGHLIIGLSETITHPERHGLKRLANSIYRKI